VFIIFYCYITPTKVIKDTFKKALFCFLPP